MRRDCIYTELSARREYIAKNTGAPEALVKFAHSRNGWILFVVRSREGIWKKNDGAGAVGASSLGPVLKNNGQKDGELRRKHLGNDFFGEYAVSMSISVLDERTHSRIMPWSLILKTTAFKVLGLSVIWVRRLNFPVEMAMAIDGVKCMKKFILRRVSYFTTLLRNHGNPKACGIETITEA